MRRDRGASEILSTNCRATTDKSHGRNDYKVLTKEVSALHSQKMYLSRNEITQQWLQISSRSAYKRFRWDEEILRARNFHYVGASPRQHLFCPLFRACLSILKSLCSSNGSVMMNVM